MGELDLSATLLDAELENEIDGFVYDTATFAYTYGNKEGTSQRQGVELTASVAMSDRLVINAAYTYTYSVEADGACGYRD